MRVLTGVLLAFLWVLVLCMVAGIINRAALRNHNRTTLVFPKDTMYGRYLPAPEPKLLPYVYYQEE